MLSNLQTLVELLKSFPPFVVAQANPLLLTWGIIGILTAIPLELMVRRRRSSYGPGRWWKIAAALALRIVIGVIAFTSVVSILPANSFSAFFAGAASYIGTIWAIRVLVALEIFLELLIDLARKQLSDNEDDDHGRLGGATAPAGAVPRERDRSVGWREILAV